MNIGSSVISLNWTSFLSALGVILLSIFSRHLLDPRPETVAYTFDNAMPSASRMTGLGELLLTQSIKTNLTRNHIDSRAKPSSLWQYPPGTYTAKEVVIQVAPLLDSLLHQLGDDPPRTAQPSRHVLVGGLQKCLALNGRSSALPVPEDARKGKRKEMASQATKIADYLVREAFEARSNQPADVPIMVRSPCEGHVWPHDVAGLLVGPRSNGMLMQVYNEWLHQLILLRDSLLPFENFEQVPLTFAAQGNGGARAVQGIRGSFLMQIMAGQVQSTSLLDVAKTHTGPNLPSGGYGFQFSHGMVLPSSFFSGTNTSLLRYVPAVLEEAPRKPLLFEPEHVDYFSAPRTFVESQQQLEPTRGNLSVQALNQAPKIQAEPSSTDGAQTYHLYLQGSLEAQAGHESQFKVDLGQVARGLRYAYHPLATSAAAQEDHKFYVHDAAAILSNDGLVDTKQKGVHVIATRDPVVRLALLGKLYPEDVVVGIDPENLEQSAVAGKGFGSKFVIAELDL